MPKRPLFLLFLSICGPALAQENGVSETATAKNIAETAPRGHVDALPDSASVATALSTHPSVESAKARLAEAKARADALRKGSHEFVFSGNYTRRSVDREGTFDEYDATLSRAVRLPGKAALDRDIGRYGVEASENLAEDARHQAALLLADHWCTWLSASARLHVDEQAVANYERALAAVNRRLELRDASRLEVDQATAALAGAKLAAEQSRGEVALARLRLIAQFPTLAVPVDAPFIPPIRVEDEELVALRAQVIANSHEIAAAEAEAKRMAAVADRVDKDRLADPSVGVRLFSERGGLERGAGVVVSVPLGGGHRRALADEAEAGYSAAQAQAQLARFNVSETAETDLAAARSHIASWRLARVVLESQVAALSKTRIGHKLGEVGLADVLLAERYVHDAFRSEIQARADAFRAITKLRIDSHELWIKD